MDYLFKIVVVGESGVGKSALLLRFIDGSYKETFASTIGVDFQTRTVECNGKSVKLQLWDTAGQERFRTVTQSYYRGSNGVLLVFDLADDRTFVEVQRQWLQEVRRSADVGAVCMLIGNKCDLTAKRQVQYDVAEAFARSNSMRYLETSARLQTNVDVMFMQMTDEIMRRGVVPLHGHGLPTTLPDSRPVGKDKCKC